MTITRELLEAQRSQYLAEKDQLVGQVNARVGAINVIDQMLAVLDQPDTPQPPAEKKAPAANAAAQ